MDQIMKSTKPITIGIMLALVLWGIYLAVGATGMFIQEDMMDVRKSGIVVACVAMFLGLWAIVLFGLKAKKQRAIQAGSASLEESTSYPEPLATSSKVVRSSPRWSIPGLVTGALLLTGALLWGVGIATWQTVSLSVTTWLGWLAALCVVAAATSGIIALSAKLPLRGKWLGLLGLAGFAAAFIVFLARMTP